MRARGAKRRAQRGALLCGLLLAGCGGQRAPAPAPPIIGVPDTGLEDTGLRPARGAPSGSPLETPDSSAPVPAGLPADCGLERMTPPHWSKALPWLIADPRLEDGIAVADPDVTGVRGVVTPGGAFYIDVLLRENGTYDRFEMDGAFDGAGGRWEWVMRSVGKDGRVHEREVEAEWAGCRWRERYRLELPFYGESVIFWSDSYIIDNTVQTTQSTTDNIYGFSFESILYNTGEYDAHILAEYESSDYVRIDAWIAGSTLEQTITAETSTSFNSTCFCGYHSRSLDFNYYINEDIDFDITYSDASLSEDYSYYSEYNMSASGFYKYNKKQISRSSDSLSYDRYSYNTSSSSCEAIWENNKSISNPCNINPDFAFSSSRDSTLFPPRHIWRP